MFSKIAVISGLVATTTFALADTGAVNQQALAPTQTTSVKQALTLINIISSKQLSILFLIKCHNLNIYL